MFLLLLIIIILVKFRLDCNQLKSEKREQNKQYKNEKKGDGRYFSTPLVSFYFMARVCVRRTVSKCVNRAYNYL